MAANPIVHVEIPAHDQQASSEFYAKVFGWNVQHFPEMEYSMFTADGGPGGGFPKIDGQMAREDHIFIMLGTDNLERTLEQVAANGGKTVRERMEIPGYGWMAIFTDPSGNHIGLWEPSPESRQSGS